MSASAATLDTQFNAPGPAASLARCITCGSALEGAPRCDRCDRLYPEVDGILEAIGPLTGTNRISATFYDSPLWTKFRFWERVFLVCQGPGEGRARKKVLRHLPDCRQARVLEVGIGDGENLPLLPAGWDVYGVDVSRNQLKRCLAKHPETYGRLAWAEGESLPFDDATFDVVYTIGGINYFRDPSAALLEMKRVARPGATVLAADELATLYRLAPGHALGLDGLDTFGLRIMGLDPDFVSMVFDTPARVEARAREVWPGHRHIPIWNRLGYCLVDFVEV
jgi:SAM-dependent methyltransferase